MSTGSHTLPEVSEPAVESCLPPHLHRHTEPLRHIPPHPRTAYRHIDPHLALGQRLLLSTSQAISLPPNTQSCYLQMASPPYPTGDCAQAELTSHQTTSPLVEDDSLSLKGKSLFWSLLTWARDPQNWVWGLRGRWWCAEARGTD
jgi:hypothetical protein